MVVILDFDFTVNVAGVPLNVTLVAPARLVPRIVTAAPTTPEVGLSFHKRTQTHRQAEDRAAGRSPSTVVVGAAIEVVP